MRFLKNVAIVSCLVWGISASALAGDLRKSIDQAAPPAQPIVTRPIPKPYLWLGGGMFTGGMAVGLYAFMHNKNGKFPGYDEFNATDRKLGAAGLFTAFGGGIVLFYGKHKVAPSVTIGGGRLTVSKQVSW